MLGIFYNKLSKEEKKEKKAEQKRMNKFIQKNPDKLERFFMRAYYEVSEDLEQLKKFKDSFKKNKKAVNDIKKESKKER